jgi:FixJ family two-component response regulator
MNLAPTVLVVDDDPFMRIVLQRVFVNAGIAVKTFASAAELIDTGDLRPPVVLLLDVKMPGMSGLELQAFLRARGIILPVMFLTGSSDIPMAVEAMRNGAVDFLEKPFDNDELVTRVRRVMAQCAQPETLPGRKTDNDTARRLRTLTAREREVYDCMIVGKTSKVIAVELGGSFRTVEIHRGRVMGKMGATHLADLVRMAFEIEGSA